MSPSQQTVLVTGFGVFAGYEVNSSWVAVKELSLMNLGIENVNLVVKEIPVEYDAIDKKIPHLFKKHKPMLVVHVGVSGGATGLVLEQCAHNIGYVQNDVKSKCPKNQRCKAAGNDVLRSPLDMQMLLESEQVKAAGLPFNTSQDAGRYCCDYIYYSSLSMQECPVIFVHVPPLSKRFDGVTLANGLRAVILAAYDCIAQN